MHKIKDLLVVKDVKNAGFTLIELLVAVLIIGILAAIAFPQYQKTVEKARAAEAFTNIRNLVDAQERHRLTKGEASSNLDDLDISLPGERVAGNRIKMKFFMYAVGPFEGSPSKYEVIAYRNAEASTASKYYLYRAYDASLNCVAQHEDAKKICSAFCSTGFTERDGAYYCGVR